MKKILSLMLSFIMLFLLTIPVSATTSNNEYQEYLNLQSQNILGKDVSFHDWNKFKSHSTQLETKLKDSADFFQVYNSRIRTTKTPYTMKSGDIFITNGTSSFGFTGHAGIAISATMILHIAGPNTVPTTISFTEWNKQYTSKGWTHIYRHSNPTVASTAGKWASTTYRNSNATYRITMDLSSTHETYCSKIVWQAYHYGPTKSSTGGFTWGLQPPYALPTTIFHLNLTETK